MRSHRPDLALAGWLRRAEHPASRKKYRHIGLFEIDLGDEVQRGFCDYVFDDMDVFDAAHAQAIECFAASGYTTRSRAAA